MEKHPTIKYKEVEQEKREVSPEKRSRMWETLKMVGLAGLLTFGMAKGAGEVVKTMDIEHMSHKGISEVDGKRVMKGEVRTADGRQWQIETSADIVKEDPAESGPGGIGGIDFNTSYLFSQNKDGSGVAVKIDVYPWGAKLTTQELGLDGKVLNERVSSIKEEPKSVIQQTQER